MKLFTTLLLSLMLINPVMLWAQDEEPRSSERTEETVDEEESNYQPIEDDAREESREDIIEETEEANAEDKLTGD